MNDYVAVVLAIVTFLAGFSLAWMLFKRKLRAIWEEATLEAWDKGQDLVSVFEKKLKELEGEKKWTQKK